MENRLTGTVVAVENRAVAVLGMSVDLGYLCVAKNEMSSKSSIFRFQIVQCGEVLAWDDQHMEGSLWIGVLKCKDLVVFKHDLRRHFSCGDLAE